jgi:hypothetical protein
MVYWSVNGKSRFGMFGMRKIIRNELESNP